MEGHAVHGTVNTLGQPTPAPPCDVSQAAANLRAAWHPPLANTIDVLLYLAEAEDKNAVDRVMGENPEGAADAVLAYRLALVHAVEELYTAPQEEESVNSVYERFFDCRFFPGDGVRYEGDVMSAEVHHAALGCALVRKVSFGGSSDQWGRDSHDLLTYTDRGSLYYRWCVVSSPVSPTILLCHRFSRTLVVVCRSSQTAKDWLSNAQTTLVEPPPSLGIPAIAEAEGPVEGASVQVHKGFGLAAASLRDGVFAAISEWKSRASGNHRVVFTGHSLGAAVAMLLAVAYGAEMRVAPPTLVTFGCPRVGNDALGAAVSAHTAHTRVVTSGDAVSKVPTSTGYVSTNADWHWKLGSRAQLVSPCDRDRDQGSSRTVPLKFFHAFRKSHPFENYMALLTRHYTALLARRNAELAQPGGNTSGSVSS